MDAHYGLCHTPRVGRGINAHRSKRIRALRQKAEKLLREAPENLALTSAKDLQGLVHSLSVYQIELEMQNDELRRYPEELEQSRSEYADLYDFAPVGYLTLDENGLITRANLTGTNLLGIERSLLVKKPFILFIHPDSQDTFYFHTHKVLEHGHADVPARAEKKGRDLYRRPPGEHRRQGRRTARHQCRGDRYHRTHTGRSCPAGERRPAQAGPCFIAYGGVAVECGNR